MSLHSAQEEGVKGRLGSSSWAQGGTANPHSSAVCLPKPLQSPAALKP